MQATGFGGGAGGFTYCVLPVASGQVLSFMVGGAGLSSAYTPGVWDLKLAGGYGGGGRSWGSGVDASAGSGGGRSAVFRAGQELVTAGGGGGGGVQCKNDATNYMAAGGGGGGLTAPLTGNFYTTTTTGGSQTAGGVSSCGGTTGGSRGSGGNAVAYGPGGGGGYFGGAGSCDLGCISPGGSGGSSYIAQCLLGSYSIAGSKGGMPGSAQALPPNTTDVVSYVTGNGVGGLAQINAAGRGGHGLIAISYAYSPTAVPTPAPTKPSPAPTAVPTTPPTRVPTFGAPTPLPTRRPSQMAPAIGPYFFQTLHGGSECRSMPARYTVETFVLGLCMPPDELNSAPYVVSCKKSIYGVSSSLWISRYSSADGTCKAGPASGPVSLSRGRSCEQQPRGAGYELSQCGDIPLSIRARQQLLIKAYPQPETRANSQYAVQPPHCFSPSVVTRSYLLGVCSPYKEAGKRIKYHERLALLSSTPGGVVVLQESRYTVSDTSCTKPPFLQKQWTYTLAQGGCKRDPLDNSLAYIQALFYDGNALNWPEVNAFISSKMVPTTAPTPQPTRPTAPPTL